MESTKESLPNCRLVRRKLIAFHRRVDQRQDIVIRFDYHRLPGPSFNGDIGRAGAFDAREGIDFACFGFCNARAADAGAQPAAAHAEHQDKGAAVGGLPHHKPGVVQPLGNRPTDQCLVIDDEDSSG